MKNKTRITVFGLFLCSILFYACQKEMSGNIKGTINPDQPHPITIYLTDHQTPVFDSVFIDLRGVEVKLEDDTLSNGGWVKLIIHPGVYNILRFRNGLDTLFATGSLPNERIRKIKLIVGTQNRAMKNGQQYPLRVKDEDREVIANVEPGNFEITSNGTILFW
ncbi:MAG TPA: DUF4382 domain-containing protein, partial [Chitinophagaceae bacterium]|nr:DUF4382 domain-containing protein [Chitinophagaceae bacterium]